MRIVAGNELETRKINLYDSKTCTSVGLATNIVLAIFKLFAGIFGFSYAMIADSIHSFSDCVALLSKFSVT